jgi:hypothetical protein
MLAALKQISGMVGGQVGERAAQAFIDIECASSTGFVHTLIHAKDSHILFGACPVLRGSPHYCNCEKLGAEKDAARVKMVTGPRVSLKSYE